MTSVLRDEGAVRGMSMEQVEVTLELNFNWKILPETSKMRKNRSKIGNFYPKVRILAENRKFDFEILSKIGHLKGKK